MKEIVEIEMERDLNKVSVWLLYHWTRSGCSDFPLLLRKEETDLDQSDPHLQHLLYVHPRSVIMPTSIFNTRQVGQE